MKRALKEQQAVALFPLQIPSEGLEHPTGWAGSGLPCTARPGALLRVGAGGPARPGTCPPAPLGAVLLPRLSAGEARWVLWSLRAPPSTALGVTAGRARLLGPQVDGAAGSSGMSRVSPHSFSLYLPPGGSWRICKAVPRVSQQRYNFLISHPSKPTSILLALPMPAS